MDFYNITNSLRPKNLFESVDGLIVWLSDASKEEIDATLAMCIEDEWYEAASAIKQEYGQD